MNRELTEEEKRKHDVCGMWTLDGRARTTRRIGTNDGQKVHASAIQRRAKTFVEARTILFAGRRKTDNNASPRGRWRVEDWQKLKQPPRRQVDGRS